MTDSDIDQGVEIVQEFQPDELGARGRAQFFFHHRGNDLPVRDVTGTQGHGDKVEPCIERKAENYCTKCIPENISSFADDDSERYLLLFTRVRNSELQANGEQFYVGYIDKRRKLDINGRTAIQGPIKLVSFEDACPLSLVGSPDTRNQKRLNEEKTEKILSYLDDAENIYHECVEEVERLEKRVGRPRLWEEGGVPPETDDPLHDESSGC
ncbi:hypothetical protein K0C01_05210 [Salinarchaeum sp. IM2453]|uniref:hypothetical protein n=1 Tax=Salinarchaeum sp. IM2453 TaxID=2862870 RepID=UPI001C83C73A|nr:hypothetical protein [Salinarchaeum sp. IM2453]QZA89532.1 hypothetical protein K0C01_05210 [Salinarchaeum sp. IM2453]